MNFKSFAAAIATRFAQLSGHELFHVNISGQAVWDHYLASFPPGADPIFKTRTQHNGSYDRHFVRTLGNVVAITDDNKLMTLWDIPNLEPPYNTVAASVSELIRTATAIDRVFRTSERTIGHRSNVAQLPDGTTHQFTHFIAGIYDRHRVADKSVDTVIGELRARAHVFERGLVEITPEAVETVLDLIDQKSLYRGDEFETVLRMFQKLQAKFKQIKHSLEASAFVWQNCDHMAARLRNTVIGTLLTDLSDGVDVERALRAYEQKVAPTNYKRPTAAITPKMVTAAMATIQNLGLEPAIPRRLAAIADISVHDVRWVDNSSRSLMKQNDLKDLLMTAVKPVTRQTNRTHQISVDEFMESVLPEAAKLEVFFAGSLQPNLMTLTTAVNADAPALFKWNSSFAWSYNGNITDSIKEKVKAAGGNTNAKLRVSLAWFNTDDLDLYAQCPDGHIYFCNKQGILDVDMNVSQLSRTPVENMAWTRPRDGVYIINVHQYRRRETQDVGFVLEVENDGRVTQYSYPKAVTGVVSALKFEVRQGKITNLRVQDAAITGQGISKQIWNVTTEQFVPVRTVLNSPNHWDGNAVGNKHLFFILDGCRTDEPVRGIYNEFLRSDLEEHRKVFEVLGNKTKCDIAGTDQLSGLGFSSTKRESVQFRVTTSTSTQIYEVQF